MLIQGQGLAITNILTPLMLSTKSNKNIYIEKNRVKIDLYLHNSISTNMIS